MVIPNPLLAQIAREINDFYMSRRHTVPLEKLTADQRKQFQLLMVSQIIARVVADA